MNLLIELNNFHEEVLYGEYNNLDRSESFILTTSKNYKNGLFDLIPLNRKFEFNNPTSIFSVVLQTNSLIKNLKITKVTFITCERKFEIVAFLLLKILNFKLSFYRFSHNIPTNYNYFYSNVGELISILLADKNFVIDNRVKTQIFSNKFQYREVFYGKFKDKIDLILPKNFKHNKDDVFICVIGTISFKRRNYISLLDEISKITNSNVKFIMLTNYKIDDGISFFNQVKNSKWRNRFVFFDYYLNYFEFCKVIDMCHASALLFDKSVPLMNDYVLNKVSSAIKFSEEFNKMILVSKDFPLDLKSNSIYYNSTYISESINTKF